MDDCNSSLDSSSADGLVARASVGDEDSISELLEYAVPHVERIASQALRVAAPRGCYDCEDLSQDCLARIVEVLRAGPEHPAAIQARTMGEFLGGWLPTIVQHEAISHARHDGAARRGGDFRRCQTAAESLPDDPESGPRRQSELREAQSVVQHSVDRLPDQEREIVVLFYWKNLSYNEISAATGLTTAAISMRLTRARRRLESDPELQRLNEP